MSIYSIRKTSCFCVCVIFASNVVYAQSSVYKSKGPESFDYYATGSSVLEDQVPSPPAISISHQQDDEKSPSDQSPVVPKNDSEGENAPGPVVAHDAIGSNPATQAEAGSCVDCEPRFGRNFFSRGAWARHGIEVGGWLQAGYSNKSTGLYNSHTSRVNLHQTWLFAERQRNECCGWDWGFRLDAVYGGDAQNTQAFGNRPGNYDFQNGFDHGIYGWALPQAYVEVGQGNMSLKMGHFFSMMGYERVQSPQNFFYSRSYASVLSEPQTLTGIVGQYKTGSTDWFAGWTTGWDTGLDQFNGSSGFIGGFKTWISEQAQLGYTTTIGDFGRRGEGYAHSLVYERDLSCRLKTVVQTNMVDADGTGFENDEFGISNSWLYGLNHWMDAGTRIEWWKSDINGTGSQSTYAWTSGINMHPANNIVIRPELRYNWGAQFNGAALRQPIFGIDMIVAF